MAPFTEPVDLRSLPNASKLWARSGALPAGKAVITTGGQLAAKHVIHTVGPVYRGGERGEAEALASCHSESIRLADEHGLKSLAFPAISTGAFGYPAADAALIAISATVEALASTNHVTKVRFVLFDDRDSANLHASCRKSTRPFFIPNRKGIFMRKKLIAGNWKMYKNPDETRTFFRDFLATGGRTHSG